MNTPALRRVRLDDVAPIGEVSLDAATLAAAGEIVTDVRREGESALRRHAERLGDVAPRAPLVVTRDELQRTLDTVPAAARELLERTAERIRTFAEAQRAALHDLTTDVPGGVAGHTIAPLESAGCYAPGGRFPLPSSVLMTAVTARVAGVESIIVASPKPADITLAAAAVAGADLLLAVGGAQAVAALAFGAGDVPACDIVVGPGNRWVTAAKKIVAGEVAIDMLAGPSELVVLADEAANPAWIAADLLAQAEHDPDAVPVLVTTSDTVAAAVDRELDTQLVDLPTAETARAALQNGCAVLVDNVDDAIRACDRLAPEHLALHVRDAERVVLRMTHYGAAFVGERSAEVFGDYGIGPNHVLPTAGAARLTGGLSVLTFLRVRTWLRLHEEAAADDILRDAAALARLEGLEAHARSAERRGNAGHSDEGS